MSRTVYRFRVAAHQVDRWEIPEREGTLTSLSAVLAREGAVRWTHIRPGVPPSRRLMGISFPFVEVEVVEPLRMGEVVDREF
jgi:hypothetical protein